MIAASRLARLFIPALALLLAAPALLSGCAAGGAGSELSAKPTPRGIGQAQGVKLSLPADEPFSIVLAPTQQAPGLDGTAEGRASADKAGSAGASAKVGNVGSAAGTFQLGHAFRNDTAQQIDLSVSVAVTYAYHVSADPAVPTPQAQVNLNIFARDGRGRLLRTVPLVSLTSQDGAASSRDQRDVQFSLTLGPRDEVSVFLAGSASAECKPGHDAAADLTLSALRMEVATQAAPPVRAVPASAPASP